MYEDLFSNMSYDNKTHQIKIKDKYLIEKDSKLEFSILPSNEGFSFYNEFDDGWALFSHKSNKFITNEGLSDKPYKFNINLDIQEEIIASMTSYPARIDKTCPSAIWHILQQTMLPDKILLILSIDEFPNKEKNLPKSILALTEICEKIKVVWSNGNLKAYKKSIEAIKLYPYSIIIQVDDNMILPNNYFKTIYNEYVHHYRQCAVTSANYKIHGVYYSLYGANCLYKKRFFGNWYKRLFEEVVLKHGIDVIVMEDTIMDHAMLIEGRRAIKDDDSRVVMDNYKIITEGRLTKHGNPDYENKQRIMYYAINQFLNKLGISNARLLYHSGLIVCITGKYQLRKLINVFIYQTKPPVKILLCDADEKFEESRVEIIYVNYKELFKLYGKYYICLIDSTQSFKYPQDYLEKMYNNAFHGIHKPFIVGKIYAPYMLKEF